MNETKFLQHLKEKGFELTEAQQNNLQFTTKL